MTEVRVVEYFGEPPGFCEFGNHPADCGGGAWTLLDQGAAAWLDRSRDDEAWSIICGAHLVQLRRDPDAFFESYDATVPRVIVDVHPSTAAELGLRFGTSLVRWATLDA